MATSRSSSSRRCARSAASERSSIGSLSALLRVDLSTMSRNVAVLERNGYLLRSRSDEDGRIVQVRLTARASGRSRRSACGERDVLQDVYERLPAGERPRVVKALEILRTCLEASGATARLAVRPRGRKAVVVSRAARLAPHAIAAPLARAPGRRRGRRHGAAARDRRRLGHHGRAARGRERRASRCSRTRIATGAGLVALILTFGRISGAHFNPAVTLADASQGGLPWRDVPAYVARAGRRRVRRRRRSRTSCSTRPLFSRVAARARGRRRSSSSEFVATFGLLAVIWGCSRARPRRDAVRRRRVHHGGVLVHVVDVVREPRRDAGARGDATRSPASARPTRRASSSRSSLGAAAATLLFRWLVPALPRSPIAYVAAADEERRGMKTVHLRLRPQRRPLADGGGLASTRSPTRRRRARSPPAPSRARASIPRCSRRCARSASISRRATPQKLTDELARDGHAARHDGLRRGVPRRARPATRRLAARGPEGQALARVREIRDDIRARVDELVRRRGWGRTDVD